MKRLTIIAALKEGTGRRAAELLAAGPPLELEQTYFIRHAVFLGRDAVAFFFEGPDVEWELDDLTSDFLHPSAAGCARRVGGDHRRQTDHRQRSLLLGASRW